MHYIPSGLSLKQHSVALPTVQVFSKTTDWSCSEVYPKFDPYPLVSGVRNHFLHGQHSFGGNLRNKTVAHVYLIDLTLVWRDNPNLPKFQVFCILKQLIGHRLCSTSQYMKMYLQKHCQFSLKYRCSSVQRSAKLLDRQM